MLYNCYMSTTQIAIRTDDKTKQSISAFASSLGLSTGAFMLAAAREAMHRESVTLTPKYNPKFVEMIREAEAEYERGEYSGPFATPEEALGHLDELMARNSEK